MTSSFFFQQRLLFSLLLLAIFVVCASLADLVPGVSDSELIAKVRHEMGGEDNKLSDGDILEHLRQRIEEHSGDKEELYAEIRKDLEAFSTAASGDEDEEDSGEEDSGEVSIQVHVHEHVF